MFERKPDWPRRYEQEDMVAAGLRLALASMGPIGAIIGEFATQFVPNQRIDRLQDFVEQLAVELQDVQDLVRARIHASVPFASLTEEVTLAAIRTPTARRRKDLARALRTGFAHSDAELEGDLALVRLLETLNESQLLLLMDSGITDQTTGSPTRSEFRSRHPGVFDISPPTMGAADTQLERWALHQHYVDELVGRGLLEYTDGMVHSAVPGTVRITALGRMMLRLVQRSAEHDLTRG